MNKKWPEYFSIQYEKCRESSCKLKAPRKFPNFISLSFFLSFFNNIEKFA